MDTILQDRSYLTGAGPSSKRKWPHLIEEDGTSQKYSFQLICEIMYLLYPTRLISIVSKPILIVVVVVFIDVVFIKKMLALKKFG